MTPRANAAALLASGRRNADRFHGELFAVYVNQPNLTPEDQSALNRNVMLARAQQAHVDVLDGKDPITRHPGLCTRARHHADLRRTQPQADLAHPAHRRAARSAHRRSRRHGRSRIPPLMAANGTPRRGRLKVFLGYAAGVGKTYQMLTEAQELKRQGVDVVIGYFEPHGRKDTMALTEGLETVPRQDRRLQG